MTGQIVFDPLLPWPAIIALGVLALLGAALALWRGLTGWPLRFFAGLILVAALTQQPQPKHTHTHTHTQAHRGFQSSDFSSKLERPQ